MGLGCSSGMVEDAGLCYPACRSGYTGIATLCWPDCPSGYRNDGVDCERPTYGRGAGHRTKERCENSNDHGAKTNGCEKWGDLWYPKCDYSWHAHGCCICAKTCPTDGFKQTDISCTKVSYSRGAGKPMTPQWFAGLGKDLEYVAIGFGVLLLLIVIVIIIYELTKSKSTNNNQSSSLSSALPLLMMA